MKAPFGNPKYNNSRKKVEKSNSKYNGRKITGLMRRMLAREYLPENVGVAGYVEAFRHVLSG